MELTTFGSQPAGERVAFVTIPRQLQQRTGSALLTVQAAATRYARKTRAHAERAASARFGQVSQRRGRSFLAPFRRRGRLFSLISTFYILLPTVKRTRSARYSYTCSHLRQLGARTESVRVRLSVWAGYACIATALTSRCAGGPIG